MLPADLASLVSTQFLISGTPVGYGNHAKGSAIGETVSKPRVQALQHVAGFGGGDEMSAGRVFCGRSDDGRLEVLQQ